MMTVWWTIGANMIIFTAALKEIPTNLYEAAEVAGANVFQKFFYITIPSLKNPLIYITIMTTLASFNVFGQPQLATGGGPTNLEMAETAQWLRVYEKKNVRCVMLETN